MERQLALIEPSKPWRLGARTREIGRRGLASARAALAEHRPEDLPDQRPRTPHAA